VFKLVIATEVKTLKKKSLMCVLCAGKVDNEYACVLEYAERYDPKKEEVCIPKNTYACVLQCL
jgi:hypothetical protein